MIANNNVNPLPWYGSPAEQDSRKWWAYGQRYELATPRTNLLPFQVRRRANANTVADLSVQIYNCDGVLVRDITDTMLAGGMTIESVTGDWQNIIYRGRPVADLLPVGYHYAVMTDGVNTWYSEMFCVVSDIQKYIRLDYWSVENQEYDGGEGKIIYETGYVNTLYIKSTIARPPYENEDESQKRDGYIFTEKKTSKKLLTFVFHAPEYLCDALRIPYLSDFVRITEKGIEYKIFDFLATPRWNENGVGHFADVEVEAERDTIFKKIQPSRGYTSDIIIVGRVYSGVYNRPLGGVVVTLTGDNPVQEIGTAITDNDGYFTFRWFVNPAAYPQTITATAAAAGYLDGTATAAEQYSFAVKNGIHFTDIYLQADFVTTSTWSDFVNIWRRVELTAESTWLDYINIWQQTCVNAYSNGYSRGYNCESPALDFVITPSSVKLPKDGTPAVPVRIETDKDWVIE